MGFLIIDLESTALSQEEKELLQHPFIAGIILFSRNFEDEGQIKSLINTIKKIRPSLIVAVDQEGGKVQRFRFSQMQNFPSMNHWGARLEQNVSEKNTIEKELSAQMLLMLEKLKNLGVNFNLIPVLDLNHGKSDVIGERSFSQSPETVIQLGKCIIHLLHQMQMPSIGKHFPGHGATQADSHKTLPYDHRSKADILSQDLQPFVHLLPYLDAIMPAHVVYSAFDHYPASLSYFWLKKYLRDQLQFNGLIISDDLSMAGVTSFGDHPDRAALALEAGCDLLLMCNHRQGSIAVLDRLVYRPKADSKDRLEVFIKKYIR